ncbi:phosphodiesterase [Planctomycetales bacterium]|nr:phosphodiesterase [Planctomycetales bacterium]
MKNEIDKAILGVISDTHGEVSETKKAVELFRQFNIKTILHCGDIGGVSVVECFAGFDTHFVYGNTDGESRIVADAVQKTGGTLHNLYGEIECCGKRIFFLHGHQIQVLQRAVHSKKYDLVCYGHTHIAAFEIYEETMVLNPGAFRRVAVPTVAVVKLPEITVETLTVR